MWPGPSGQVARAQRARGINSFTINFSIINVDINIMNINKINISTIKINNNYISISVDIIIRNNITTVKINSNITDNNISFTNNSDNIIGNNLNITSTNNTSFISIIRTITIKINSITNIGTNNSSTKITNINKTAAPSTRCHQHQLAGAAAAQQLVAPTPALGAGGAPLRGEYTTKRAQRCCAPWCRW